MRKITRKGLIRKLDKVIKDIVIARDNRQCVCCWDRTDLTPGHLFTRQVLRTRWDLDNVFCQCRSCNLRHEYYPFPLTNYYLKNFGQKKYEELHKKFWKPKPVKTWELKELLEELELIKQQYQIL
jgi:5-methylcytosine-specific restriction endonuclease McrA